MGVDCIVVNPADIPTTNKEVEQKNDPRDSKKISRNLRANELSSIYIPDETTLQNRTVSKRCFICIIITC